MSEFSLEALLGLYSIPSIGPTRLRKLISVMGSPERVLEAGLRTLMQIEGIDRTLAERIKQGPDEQFVTQQMKKIREYGVHVLTYWDQAYPEGLKKIYDPPVFLFYRGNTEILQDKAIAVVGTRLPTSYGRTVTERFVQSLVEEGFIIISGFARGVDSLAHHTALRACGGTVAVLGNGLDVIYPPENVGLFRKMCEHGLILSEYPMGTRPDAGNFPKRNRIISGLSVAVLICEAGLNSGALLTAMYANDQNRDVFVIPGSILSPKSQGCNRLIRQGAIPVQSPEEMLEELSAQLQLSLNKPQRSVPRLEGNLKKIYEALGNEPMHVDQIALKTDLSPAETLSSLLTLELMGVIRQMAGKMFIRL